MVCVYVIGVSEGRGGGKQYLFWMGNIQYLNVILTSVDHIFLDFVNQRLDFFLEGFDEGIQYKETVDAFADVKKA